VIAGTDTLWLEAAKDTNQKAPLKGEPDEPAPSSLLVAFRPLG
jgi:hypothetical protein